jgi:DNA repair protein RecO (recombination protein O)
MPTSDQAICLRAIDYSETSQVLWLLGREGGLVRVLAKGSKRPKNRIGGPVDLFAEGRAVYTGGGGQALGTLIEFADQSPRSALRADLRRLSVGVYMLELCGELLADGDPHPRVFDLLHNALARLDQPDSDPPAVLAYFQWRLLGHVGLLGAMDRCAGCDGPVGRRGAYFSSSAGGLLCRNCEGAAAEKRAVAPEALDALAALAAAAAGRKVPLPTPAARAVNALLAYHVEYQLGKRLKTAAAAVKG